MVGERAHPVGGDAGVVGRALDEHQLVDAQRCERRDVAELQVAKRHGQPQFGGITARLAAQRVQQGDAFGDRVDVVRG